jgi:tight adherence protein C
MTPLFILVLLILAAVVVLLARAFALPRLRMADHLRQIDTYGLNAVTPAEAGLQARPPLGESINSIAEGIGDFAAARVASLRPVPVRELASAGFYRITSEAFHGYRVLTAAGAGVIFAIWFTSSGENPALGILVGIVGAAVVYALFGAFVRSRSEKRLREIDRELPELIDVLIATIEAGLGFAGSLQMVAGRFDGPLGSELRLALQEAQMGLATNVALANILERSDTPALRSFVRAVAQGETFGVSIGMMMRNLALEMRTRRRQAAQEQVQRAPLKMLFPLVGLLFPAMLIVLLYPAAHELIQGFAALK